MNWTAATLHWHWWRSDLLLGVEMLPSNISGPSGRRQLLFKNVFTSYTFSFSSPSLQNSYGDQVVKLSFTDQPAGGGWAALVDCTNGSLARPGSIVWRRAFPRNRLGYRAQLLRGRPHGKGCRKREMMPMRQEGNEKEARKETDEGV